MNKRLEKATNQKDPQRVLDLVVSEYVRMGQKIAEYKHEQGQVKKIIEDLLIELHTNKMSTSAGRKVSWIEPVSYAALDTKKVLAVCSIDEEVADKLEPCFMQRDRKGYVKVG